MTDPSTAERLAALQARNRRADRPAPPAVIAPSASGPVVPSEPAPTAVLSLAPEPAPSPIGARPVDGPSMLRFEMPWTRVATGGASVVSFAAMVVAMGPLLTGTESTAVATDGPDASLALAPEADTPTAPPVTVAVVAPAAAPADGTPAVAPATPAPAAGSAPAADAAPAAAQPATPSPSTAAPAAAPSATAAPATAPPATAPPATQPPASDGPTTAPPATAAPTTAPPATAPATTAAPTTAPPTTAPPQTAAPTTAPPRTDGSG